MDWVRSCYSTTMLLDRLGNAYPVDWYFVPVTTPLFAPGHPVSLNWTKPEYGQQTIGEVPHTPRPYSKGARPAYIPAAGTFPQVGADAAFTVGAPGPLATLPPITWEGRRTFSGGPPAGIFPPSAGWPTACTSSVYGLGNSDFPPTGDPEWWQWGAAGTLHAAGFHPLGGLGNCPTPPIVTMWVGRSNWGGAVYHPLRCTAYTPGVSSTWDDPTGGGLDAGETLTLAGP